MGFHAINKNIDGSVTTVHIDKIAIERVSNLANKITKLSGGIKID